MHLRGPREITVALASISVLALSACGGSSSSSSPTSSAASSSSTAASSSPTTTAAAAPAAAAGASVVKLSAKPNGALAFNTMKLTVKAGKVTVEMKNPASSGVPHGIAVEGNGVDQDGKTVSPGGTSTDTLTLKPGTYKFYCPVPGHEAAGMKGTLVVT
jgi:plastocyanin